MLGLFLANDLLGVYADGYAFGQLDGEVLGRPSYVIYNSDVQFFKNNLFHVINFSGWSTLYRRANTTDYDCQGINTKNQIIISNGLITRLTGQMAGIFEIIKNGTQVIDTNLTKFLLIKFLVTIIFITDIVLNSDHFPIPVSYTHLTLPTILLV